MCSKGCKNKVDNQDGGHKSSVLMVLKSRTFLNICTNALLLFMSWAVPWSVLEENCLPGSNIFGIIVLVDCCILAGKLVASLKIPFFPTLPPLLGMILMGFCLVNIPVVNVASDIDSTWSSVLRSIALTTILVKAGLELDGSALKQLKAVCLRLTCLPCLFETVTCAVASKLLLNFPWEWGFLLGFVLGAVTPAVIVPSMISLQESGYGIEKGVPTLVIAASSFDDVVAISGFSVVLGITFSSVGDIEQGDVSNNATIAMVTNYTLTSTIQSTTLKNNSAGTIAWMILRGPVEMLTGIIIGTILGLLLWVLPNAKEPNVTEKRSMFVFGFGILSLFSSRIFHFPGAGALAAIVTPFVACLKWGTEKDKVSAYISKLWIIFEPIMFGLIGAEIKLDSISSGTVGTGLAVLFIGLVIRCIASYGAVLKAGFNSKEKMFISLAWLPKATVQAAIGPLALDMARNVGASPEIIAFAEQVLTIAVLSILITSPLGAAAIGLLGPKLLHKKVDRSSELSKRKLMPCQLVENKGEVVKDDSTVSNEDDVLEL